MPMKICDDWGSWEESCNGLVKKIGAAKKWQVNGLLNESTENNG